MASRLSGFLASAGLGDVPGFKALFNESPRLCFIQSADPFDDAGFDGPDAVECCEAAVSYVCPAVEPLVTEGVVL